MAGSIPGRMNGLLRQAATFVPVALCGCGALSGCIVEPSAADGQRLGQAAPRLERGSFGVSIAAAPSRIKTGLVAVGEYGLPGTRRGRVWIMELANLDKSKVIVEPRPRASEPTVTGFGAKVEFVGHLDSDREDVCVVVVSGGPLRPSARTCALISTSTGKLHWLVSDRELFGENVDSFGESMVVIGDVNANGSDDIALSARGGFVVIDGATASLVFRHTTGDLSPVTIRGVGDLDGDDVEELLCAVDLGIAGSRATCWNIHDARTTVELWEPSASFGAAACGLPDLDGDGSMDFAVGDPDWNEAHGRFVAYSGATGQVIRMWEGEDAGGRLGSELAMSTGPGGVVVAAGAAGLSGHELRMFSASAEKPIAAWCGNQAQCPGCDYSVCRSSDVDGDGMSDFLVGTRRRASMSCPGEGRFYVVSASTGQTLKQLGGP